MLSFNFQEMPGPDDKPQVVVTFGTSQWGDPLNDNIRGEDFFRYHDLIHLGMYALFNWSPVTRHFLGQETEEELVETPLAKMILETQNKTIELQRNYSVSKEACQLEEILSLLIFTAADDADLYRDRKPLLSEMNIPYQLVQGTTMRDFTKKQWSQNIAQIFGVYRQMIDHRGGYVDVDPETKYFAYRP
jgi:hypothetical protein